MLVSQMYGLGDGALVGGRGTLATLGPRYATTGTKGQPSTAPPSARSPDLKPLTMFSIARPATLAPVAAVDVNKLRAAVTAVSSPSSSSRPFDPLTAAALKKAAAAVISKPTGLPFSSTTAVQQAAADVAATTSALTTTTTGPTAADAAAAMSTGGGGGGSGGDVAPADQPVDDTGAPIGWWEGLSPAMKAAVVGGGLAVAFLGYKVMRKHT